MKISELDNLVGLTAVIDGYEVAVIKIGHEIKVFANSCTHRHCLVAWNSDETVWDCPCHGSRFAPDGLVLRGPAPSPLVMLRYTITDGEIRVVA